MPLYDFTCIDKGCGRTFEALLSSREAACGENPRCPHCGALTSRRMHMFVLWAAMGQYSGRSVHILSCSENAISLQEEARMLNERACALREVDYYDLVEEVGLDGEQPVEIHGMEFKVYDFYSNYSNIEFFVDRLPFWA